MRVATHNGMFHADDVFAIATITLLSGYPEVIRTRDPAELERADMRIDVGLRDDPARGDFDHHQVGGAGERANGIRYASFGLIWRQFGDQLCGDPAIAAHVDHKLVQIVDGNDNGQTCFDPCFDDLHPMTVDRVITLLNPTWDQQPTFADYDRCFYRAVTVAASILEGEISDARARVLASGRIQQAIADATDPRLICLDEDMPWREPIVEGAPEALYVIVPKPDGWALLAVPVKLGVFTTRKPLPSSWGGLTGEAFAEESGVEDAVFCHAGLFYAAASSHDGILALAARALAA